MSRATRLVALLLALLLPARLASAQAPDSAHAACSDIFAGAPGLIDSLMLVGTTGYKIERVEGQGMRSLLMSVGNFMEIPQPLQLPRVVFSVLQFDRGTRRSPGGFMAEAMLELNGDGTMKRAVLTQTSLNPVIDAALLTAVRGAAGIGLPPGIVAATRKAHGGAIFIRFATRLALAPALSKDSVGSRASIAIGALRVPMVALSSDPHVAKGSQPWYPPNAQRAAIDGQATLGFVIGEDGRAIRETLTIFGEAKREFAKASIDAVLKTQYAPAIVAGCPVAAFETQPFTFTIER